MRKSDSHSSPPEGLDSYCSISPRYHRCDTLPTRVLARQWLAKSHFCRHFRMDNSGRSIWVSGLMVMPRLRIDLVVNLAKHRHQGSFLLPLSVGAPSCKVKNKSHDENDCQ